MYKTMSAQQIYEQLLERYPTLDGCKKDIWAAYNMLCNLYQNDGKLLIAGNGGSAADADHIVGELMKSFRIQRPIKTKYSARLEAQFGVEGARLAEWIEGALPAISLPSISSLFTAYSNDRFLDGVFAQMVYGYGCAGDILLGITTSGNSQNVLNALMMARAKEMETIVLTGMQGGKCSALGGVVIRVPGEDTFAIQELHLPVYHALCAMLEAHFFEQACGTV